MGIINRLYSRKDKGGKWIWYYRTYDKFGIRATGKSIVQTSKAAETFRSNTFVINVRDQGVVLHIVEAEYEEKKYKHQAVRNRAYHGGKVFLFKLNEFFHSLWTY